MKVMSHVAYTPMLALLRFSTQFGLGFLPPPPAAATPPPLLSIGYWDLFEAVLHRTQCEDAVRTYSAGNYILKVVKWVYSGEYHSVTSCRKFYEKAKTVNFSVITMFSRKLPAEKTYFCTFPDSFIFDGL